MKIGVWNCCKRCRWQRQVVRIKICDWNIENCYRTSRWRRQQTEGPRKTFRAAIQRDNKSFDANASEWPNTGDTVHWTCGRNQKSDKFMWGCWFIYTCCRSLPVCWLLEMGSSPLTCFRGDNIWVMRRAGQKRDAANFQPIRPHLSSAEIGYSCLILLSLMLIILGAFRMDQ